MTAARLYSALLLALGTSLAHSPAQSSSKPIFRIETNEFWLSLHQFLYVLGRAQNGTADATRNAVINAPRDAEQGLARLNANDAVVWKQAVTFYSEGLSRKDAVFDEPLPAIAHALADADDAPSLRGAAIDSTIAATLERVAPIFRKAWWPTQRAGNEAWLASVQPLIDRYVAVILRDQARAAGVRVPPGLSHGMVFMTAGEAVRSVMPDHVPYADKFGVWNRGLASLHDALTTYWLPYLRGQSTLANALAGLMGKR